MNCNPAVSVNITTNQINATVSSNKVTIVVSNTGQQGPSGGGGGGGETGVIFESGSTYTINSVTPGAPFNVIVRKTIGSPTRINLPPPNPDAPWGRVNVKDGNGDSATNNITVAPESGGVDGISEFIIDVDWEGLSFLDDGTTWNIQ